ncbi:MAG: hypothetical protein RIF32_12805 [Leptospirales bacterium]|jgi:hypothetical protein
MKHFRDLNKWQKIGVSVALPLIAVLCLVIIFSGAEGSRFDETTILENIRGSLTSGAEERELEDPDADLIVDIHPLLEELDVEKQVVCPGEDVQIRAIALDADQELRYVIHGQVGDSRIEEWSEAGEYKIFAVGRLGAGKIDYKTATITVREPDDPACQNRPDLTLTTTPVPGEKDLFDFRVESVRGLVPPITYHWNFGDRASESGSSDYQRHSYTSRIQDSYASNYIVQVRAVDSQDQSATARVSVGLVNPHFYASLSGYPEAAVSYDRFPIRTKDAFVSEAQFTNSEGESVDYREATLRLDDCVNPDKSKSIVLPAHKVMGQTTLAARRNAQRTIRIPANLIGPDVCKVYVEFSGRTENDTKTQASMVLEVRAPPPTVKMQVTDEKTLVKLEKAMRIMNTDQVTPADIQRLEKQGLLGE